MYINTHWLGPKSPHNDALMKCSAEAREIIERLADYRQQRRKHREDDADIEARAEKVQITLPQLHFMRDLGDKYVSLDRLLASKRSLREQKIETLERNGPKLEAILAGLNHSEFPSITGWGYVRGTYTLTLHYIGMCVQWYSHLDYYYVQHGNEKRVRVVCNIDQLRDRMLKGRSGF